MRAPAQRLAANSSGTVSARCVGGNKELCAGNDRVAGRQQARKTASRGSAGDVAAEFAIRCGGRSPDPDRLRGDAGRPVDIVDNQAGSTAKISVVAAAERGPGFGIDVQELRRQRRTVLHIYTDDPASGLSAAQMRRALTGFVTRVGFHVDQRLREAHGAAIECQAGRAALRITRHLPRFAQAAEPEGRDPQVYSHHLARGINPHEGISASARTASARQRVSAGATGIHGEERAVHDAAARHVDLCRAPGAVAASLAGAAGAVSGTDGADSRFSPGLYRAGTLHTHQGVARRAGNACATDKIVGCIDRQAAIYQQRVSVCSPRAGCSIGENLEIARGRDRACLGHHFSDIFGAHGHI